MIHRLGIPRCQCAQTSTLLPQTIRTPKPIVIHPLPTARNTPQQDTASLGLTALPRCSSTTLRHDSWSQNRPSAMADEHTDLRFFGHVSRIRDTIEKDKHKKWGFVFYRCDYASDDAWNRFLKNYQYGIEEELALLKATDLRDSWELTTKEDRDRLDGATVDQVREIFEEWVHSEEVQIETNGITETGEEGLMRYSRYTYCVHVDADVIDSVVNRAPQPPTYDINQIGYVNLVRRNDPVVHEPDPVEFCDEEEDGEDMDDEDYSKMKDMHAPLSFLGVESYNTLYNYYSWERYVGLHRHEFGPFRR